MDRERSRLSHGNKRSLQQSHGGSNNGPRSSTTRAVRYPTNLSSRKQ